MIKSNVGFRMVAKVMAFVLTIGCGISGNTLTAKATVDPNQEVSNPISISDASMRSGKRVTYDTVFLGTYPQSEVKASDPVYAKLQAATNWNICGDTVIEGTRYRRIKQSDATGCTMDLEVWHYDEETDEYYPETVEPGIGPDGYSHWEDNDTYHYFRFDPIRWRVLNTDGNQALLLSDIALDARATDIYMWTRPADPEDVLTIDGVRYQCIDSTWDNCELRSWLNSYDASHNYYKVNCSGSGEKSFYNVAFSDSEKSAILTTSLENEGGRTSWHNSTTYEYTVGGRNTEDKIFLLSYDDVLRKYGFSASDEVADEARRCNLSDYTISMGLYGEADDGKISRDKWSVQWGLRTVTDGVSFHYGSDHYGAIKKNGERYIYRNNDGSVYNYGDWVGRFQGVRPAMMLDLSSSAYSYAGTVCTDGTYSDGTQYTLGGCDHSRNLRHVERVEATQESAGHEEYWICDSCGKVFSDAAGQNETTLFELAIPRLTNQYPTVVPTATQTPAPTISPSNNSGSGTPGGNMSGGSSSGGSSSGGASGGSSSGGGSSTGGGKPVETPMGSQSPTPTVAPTVKPSATPSATPTVSPSVRPSATPSVAPVSSETPTTTVAPSQTPANESFVSAGVTYMMNGSQAAVKSVKNKKSVTICKTIKISGKSYKVRRLCKGIFTNKRKVKKVTIEVAYIKNVDKGAFAGLGKGDCVRLKGSRTKINKVKRLIIRSGIAKGVSIIG